MRRAVLALTLAALAPQTARALDCTAPPNAFLRNICARPEAVQAWQDMEQALAAALAAAPDPAGKAAIQATQDRWIEVMEGWDVDATRAALAYEAGSDTLKTRLEYLEKNLGWRPRDVTEGDLATVIAERQHLLPDLPAAFAGMRAFRGRFPGGPFSLTLAECFYAPADQMSSRFPIHACDGSISVQAGTRLCNVEIYFYGDRINTVFIVDDVAGDTLRHRGNCDWNGLAPDCPGEWMLPEDNPHWDSDVSNDVKYFHKDLRAARARPASAPSSVDPELWLSLADQAGWLTTCLTTPVYPPPDQVWPGSGAKPAP